MFCIEVQLIRKALFKMSNEERNAYMDKHEEEFNADKSVNRWHERGGGYPDPTPDWLIEVLKKHFQRWWYDENNQVRKTMFSEDTPFELVKEGRDKLYADLDATIKADPAKLKFSDEYMIQLNIVQHNEESLGVDEELVRQVRDERMDRMNKGTQMKSTLASMVVLFCVLCAVVSMTTEQPKWLTLSFAGGAFLAILLHLLLSRRAA